MCYKLLECISVWEIVSLFLSIVLSAFAAIIIIRFFRPKIRIGIPEWDENTIKITVRNEDIRFAVSNLRIEAAAVLNNFTYHLDFDRADFIMLSEYKTYENNETPFERTFHARNVNHYTMEISPNCQNMHDFRNLLNTPNTYLRIRVHCFHEFTGFGKAFQAKFKFRFNNQGIFEQI